MSAGPLFTAMRNLDARLLRMVEAARLETGREPGADPYRGLYLSDVDVERDLRWREDPSAAAIPEPMAVGAPFERLREIFGLSTPELDILLIALAPEIDSRYERIYSYLQDDVSRKRPSIDLAASLLCSGEDQWNCRDLFGASRSLQKNRLIRFAGDDLIPIPRREVCVAPEIAAYLLGEPALARFVAFVESPTATTAALPGLIRVARATSGHRLRVFLRGTDQEAKRAAAMALAAELGSPLLIGEIRLARHAGDFEAWIGELFQAAVLRRAIVYLEDFDSIANEASRDSALSALAHFPGIALLSGARELTTGRVPLTGVFTVSFEIPDWPERRRTWKRTLQDRGIHPRRAGLDALAECFRFNISQIEDAAATAFHLAVYRGETARIEHAFEAARIRSGHELASLTRKVVPVHEWSDLVLPTEATEQLREICRRVTRRHQVMGKWGFEDKLSSGKGMNVLFHGHSGTGKTMAAEVIAHELKLDLYKIDLAGVVSKYIGETEKNLDKIFAAAQNANAILLFDEADALFGKRSEVRDSHDRYANLEVSYLLQKMEQHEGISILATNLRQNLDDAFLRRLTFTVSFPFPEEASRTRIWEGIWPHDTPVAADVDAGWLGARFLLSGGNIRNVAVAAAYFAAEDGGELRLEHVLMAVRAEFQKMGKTLTALELAPPAAAASGAAA